MEDSLAITMKQIQAANIIIKALRSWSKIRKIYVKLVFQHLIKAQKTISRVYHQKKRFVLLKKSGVYRVTIYFKKTHYADKVEIIGSFTRPAWEKSLKLEYCPFFKRFKTDIEIKEGDQFKFKVNGNFIVSLEYPLCDSGGFQNNEYRLNHDFNPQKYPLPLSLLKKSKLPTIPKEKPQQKKLSQFSPSNLEKSMSEKVVSFENWRKAHQFEKWNMTEVIKSSSPRNLEKKNNPSFVTHDLIKKSLSPTPQIETPTKFEQSISDFKTEENSFYPTIIDEPSTSDQETETTHKSFPRINTGLKFSGNYTPMGSAYQLNLSNLKNEERSDEGFDSECFDTSSNHSSVLMANTKSPKSFMKTKSSIDLTTQEEKYYKFIFAGKIISKDEEDGEDAYFANERGMGVADGVSGWSTYGLNASAFSKTLMNNCNQEMSKLFSLKSSKRNKIMNSFRSFTSLIPEENEEHEMNIFSKTRKQIQKNSIDVDSYGDDIYLIDILSKAYKNVEVCGSSTATLCALNKSKLQMLNLGDSSGCVIRIKDKTPFLYKSTSEQIHNFNIPYQLANFPDKKEFDMLLNLNKIKELTELQAAINQNKLCNNSVHDSEILNITVLPNDIVVLGTDGLFDNLFPFEINRVIKKHYKKKPTISICQKMANDIANLAYQKSKKLNARTPFADKYKQYYNESWTRGKEDDITVVVGIVIEVILE